METELESRLTRLERLFTDLLLKTKLEEDLMSAQEVESDKLEDEHDEELEKLEDQKEHIQSRHFMELEELAEKHDKEITDLLAKFPDLVVKAKKSKSKK